MANQNINKLQVRFTGERGKVDGYVESFVGMLAVSGMLIKQPKWNKRYRANGIVQIYLNCEVVTPPLGHLGDEIIQEVPFKEGESE